MFATPGPRIFTLPPGADVPAALAAGLMARLDGAAPEALARVRIIANTRRAARGIATALAAAASPALLPRVQVIEDLADHPDAPEDLPPAIDPLRRRLHLVTLVRAYLDRSGEGGPLAARFDLAARLEALLDELAEAGIDPAAVVALDTGAHAAHWQRTARFLGILTGAWPAILAEAGRIDGAARQRALVQHLAGVWATRPPAHPVILAGSTGSRPVTRALMRAVAGLPQGAIVLPGVDPHLSPEVWAALGPDHPQAALGGVFEMFGTAPGAAAPWHGVEAEPRRARLLSHALRPAPVTDGWRAAIPTLAPDVAAATAGLTLVEAARPGEEALAIALILRGALERGLARAALVTPDRALARRVATALGRWGIVPDDTAGRPLALTPPGIFLRLLARLAGAPPRAEALVELLKHPLAGAVRPAHVAAITALERHLRREALPLLDLPALAAWGADAHGAWGRGVADALAPLAPPGEAPFATRAADLLAAATALSGDRAFAQEDGAAAHSLLARLAATADLPMQLGAPEFSRALDTEMAGVDVRAPGFRPEPRIAILGALEARIEGAPLMVLGGLTEGTWPNPPGADPWLSRPMRAALGLAPPERQLGLSAHDFQSAFGAAEVVLTRALRAVGSPTVASRWLTRFENLVAGLGGNGTAALGAMRARGAAWIAAARALDAPDTVVPPAPRPAPRPPVPARPRSLSVTEIETLIRDPYAVYARRVLGLRPLDPLGRPPDARDRGTVIHHILARFAREVPGPLPPDAALRLRLIGEAEIAARIPWPAERRLWRGRLLRSIDWFVAGEAARRAAGRTVAVEMAGAAEIALPGGPFTLTAKADRIDAQGDGTLAVYDYKTGPPPTEAQVEHFARQLWLEAGMAEAGGFPGLAPAPVGRLAYLGVTGAGEGGAETAILPGAGDVAAQWARFRGLMARHDDPETPYVSRLRPLLITHAGDYDHLARVGEWSIGAEGEEGE